MLHALIFGLLLGWGAAIPMGPINLEIIRRNLRLGTRYAIGLGMGACLADITYVLLLSLGALVLLTHVIVLKTVGVLGSFVLAWFGISALRMRTQETQTKNNEKIKPAWRHTIEGYFLTLLSPFTILFWASVSSQVALFAHTTAHAIWYAAAGVLLGTASWIIGFNTLLHFTRHKLSPRTIHLLNYLGGLILLGYAAFGLWHAVVR